MMVRGVIHFVRTHEGERGLSKCVEGGRLTHLVPFYTNFVLFSGARYFDPSFLYLATTLITIV